MNSAWRRRARRRKKSARGNTGARCRGSRSPIKTSLTCAVSPPLPLPRFWPDTPPGGFCGRSSTAAGRFGLPREIEPCSLPPGPWKGSLERSKSLEHGNDHRGIQFGLRCCPRSTPGALGYRDRHGRLGSRPRPLLRDRWPAARFGRVSRAGVIPLSWTLDHPGPMARTVGDAALLLQGMRSGPERPKHAQPAAGGFQPSSPGGFKGETHRFPPVRVLQRS